MEREHRLTQIDGMMANLAVNSWQVHRKAAKSHLEQNRLSYEHA